MRIDVLTIFPEIFPAPLAAGLLGKALDAKVLDVAVTNIRDFATDAHRTVDDAPFGGGPGMVMKCEPLFEAVESLRGRNSLERVILLSPRGRRLDQSIVRGLAETKDFVLICGRYEGVDERVSQALATDELSIGDYVLSGGEMAALVVIDAVARLVPGVVGDPASVESDSFAESFLGAPQYTRPAEYRGMRVPEVLLSGHHAEITRFRRTEALRATLERRPELLTNCSPADRAIVERLKAEMNGEGAGTKTRANAPSTDGEERIK